MVSRLKYLAGLGLFHLEEMFIWGRKRGENDQY